MHINELLPIPPTLCERYADWQWTIAYQLAPEAVTYRLAYHDGTIRYVKLTEASWFPRLLDEAARMQWARAHLPVPDIVESGTADGIDWMMTEALPGVDATNDKLKAQPVHLVQMLARGLRRFHEAPVDDCPFGFELDVALAHAERRATRGLIDAARDFHPEHQHLTVDQALRQLERTRPACEDLVVCHGDYCFPNALIEGEQVVGFVDLGELGVADRWWDVAVATWSTVWNLGPGYEGAFLAAYEIEPDTDRITFYRLLYDLVS